MRSIVTASFPVCSTPSPPPCPVTSAEGENTRRYSNGSSNCVPSSKVTSRTRERVRSLICVGCGMRLLGLALQNVARQILIVRQLAQVALDVGSIDHDVRAAPVRGIE